jgi:hypothetical protein
MEVEIFALVDQPRGINPCPESGFPLFVVIFPVLLHLVHQLHDGGGDLRIAVGVATVPEER